MATKLAVPKLSATDKIALRIRKSEERLAALRAKADVIEQGKAAASGRSADAKPNHDVADVGQKQISAFSGNVTVRKRLATPSTAMARR